MKIRSDEERERILVYGPGGAGKTFDAVMVAKFASDVTWTIDIDNAIGIVARKMGVPTSRTDVANLKRPEEGLCVVRPTDWVEFTEALEAVARVAEPDDWIVVDSISLPWSWVQSWLVEQLHGKTMTSWLVEWRASQIEAGRGGRDTQQALLADGAWQLINKAWHETVTKLAINPPCHLFLTAEAKSFGAQESQATREMYARFGVKPEGQWGLGYKVRSVFLREKHMDKRLLTTVKDWGREDNALERAEVPNFALGFLKEAGWQTV